MILKKFSVVSLFLISSSFTLFNQAFAVRGSPEDAAKLREAIELKETAVAYGANDNSKYKVILPVSRSFDQKETGLCWAYAFLNALETMHLVNHPGETFELSRGAMQYINLKDRIELKIQGVEDHLNPELYPDWMVEGGTGPDAAWLIEHFGLVQYQDYHDIISPPHYTDLLNTIFATSAADEQRLKADTSLPEFFASKIPESTISHGKQETSLQFGKSLLGNGHWVSYAISKDGSEYLAKDPDSDARRGAMTYYISREKIVEKIRTSLANGLPVLYSNIRHLVLIFGAEYSAKNNSPLAFQIKDNYAGHDFYVSSASKTLDNLGEITILE